jgi:hypothetical protein
MSKNKPVRVYTQNQVKFIGLNLLHRLQQDSSITSDLDFDNDHTANGICGYIDELIIELKDYGHMKDVGILPYGKPQ